MMILVPQGAEHRAVRRGLRRVGLSSDWICPIPIGSSTLRSHLEHYHQHHACEAGESVIVAGVCGSLSPDLHIGDAVVCRSCMTLPEHASAEVIQCDRPLTDALVQALEPQVDLVNALTSDRLIWSASEKRALGQTHHADIVDMEGHAALALLHQWEMKVAILRVVSDDCFYDLPDLNPAIDARGDLQPLPLTKELITHPVAALRLIRGSLVGLNALERRISQVFTSLPSDYC
ncbi:MAG: phosphorylase [Elainellaceae cyanobacterium]